MTPGGQLVAEPEPLHPLVEGLLDLGQPVLELLDDGFHLLDEVHLRLDVRAGPGLHGDLVDVLVRDGPPGAQEEFPGRLVPEVGLQLLVEEDLLQFPPGASRNDAESSSSLSFSSLALSSFSMAMRSRVLLDPAPGEDLGVDDDPFHTRRHPEGGVLHIPGLVPEDRPKQLLLGGELGLPFGRDLANQDVPGLHIGADLDDPALVQELQRLLADVRDVPGDLLFAELSVPGDGLELLDVDRGVDVLLDDPLADDDRVLKVVPAPGHEGDHDVLPQGQLPELGRGTVRNDLTFPDRLPPLDDGLLVVAGVLVGFLVLRELVDLDLVLPAVLARPDHDTGGIHVLHDPVPPCDDGDAGIPGDHALHTGADQRRLGLQEGNRLPLHVRAHKGAVRVVVLEEGNERCGDTDQLIGRHIHVLHARGRGSARLSLDPDGHLVPEEVPFLVHRRIGLCDGVVLFVQGGKVLRAPGHPPVLHLAVRGLDEPILVHPGIGAERDDEPDVRPFRCLDRADAAIVGGMHVADFETRPAPW